MYGKRHMLPSPIAEPAAAAIIPIFEPKLSRLEKSNLAITRSLFVNIFFPVQ
jgi:hypothetical protein